MTDKEPEQTKQTLETRVKSKWGEDITAYPETHFYRRLHEDITANNLDGARLWYAVLMEEHRKMGDDLGQYLPPLTLGKDHDNIIALLYPRGIKDNPSAGIAIAQITKGLQRRDVTSRDRLRKMLALTKTSCPLQYEKPEGDIGTPLPGCQVYHECLHPDGNNPTRCSVYVATQNYLNERT